MPTTPEVVSLHDLKLRVDQAEDEPLQDYSTARCHFRQLPEKVAHLIRQYDYVFGCVAWLMHPLILDALATCKGTSIIVQKEDFLRPDSSPGRSLHEQYARVRGMFRIGMPGLAGSLSYASSEPAEGIRCVGNHNRDRKAAHPRSHHKFLVFCRVLKDKGSHYEPDLVPDLVWTGSFNFTINGGRSFENAVLLDDPESCNAFLNEWAQVFALSEPLDWTSDWCEPEYRIGT